MLYDSPHVRVTADDGVATLWLEFPGPPVNALTAPRVAEIGRALDAVLPDPHLEVLVVRSGKPAGFCGGHHPDTPAHLATEADRTAFAGAGQGVLNRLADADLVTVAFLEGPCLGPGMELALACDYRLAVTGPDAWVGLADPTGLRSCWGGPTRLRRLLGRPAADRLTAREGQRVGLVDHAFCARRAKIELRTFLDRLQFRPRKRRLWRGPSADSLAEGLAAERAAFRQALPPVPDECLAPLPDSVPPFPELVGLIGGSDQAARLAVEVALRGTRAVVCGEGMVPRVDAAFAEAVRRGRATPLEADQAGRRVRVTAELDGDDRPGLVIAWDSDGAAAVETRLPPRTVLAVPAHRLPDMTRAAIRPGRLVGLTFSAGDRAEVTPGPRPDLAEAVIGWLARGGFGVVARPVSENFPLRWAA